MQYIYLDPAVAMPCDRCWSYVENYDYYSLIENSELLPGIGFLPDITEYEEQYKGFIGAYMSIESSLAITDEDIDAVYEAGAEELITELNRQYDEFKEGAE